MRFLKFQVDKGGRRENGSEGKAEAENVCIASTTARGKGLSLVEKSGSLILGYKP